jgi:hypothetical protein
VTCSEFLAQFDNLIDDDGTTALRADLREHMVGCEHCEITYNTTLKTIQIYREHEIYALPDEMRERLHTLIVERCRKC